MGWAKIRVLRDIQLLAGTPEAVRVGAGAITNLKSLELAKKIVKNNERTPERIPVA